jgi:hypothetical protein
MRAIPALPILLLCCRLAGAESASPSAGDDLPSLRAQVQTLTEQVQKLEKRLETLEKRKPKAVAERGPGGFTSRKADSEALDAITIPDQPTREQIVAYCTAIAEASAGQNSFSPTDPQVGMLRGLGAGAVPALIAQLGKRHEMDFFLQYALKDLVAEEHKGLVIKSLGSQRELVGIVASRGWAKDARAVLLAGLGGAGKGRSYLPTEWIEAVAQLRDPATYPGLIDVLVHGQNRASTYEAIRRLPGIVLAPAMQEAWDMIAESGIHDQYERDAFCPHALQCGVKGAFEHAVGSLLRTRVDNEWQQKRIREAVESCSDAPDDMAALKTWFEGSKDLLTWDAVKRRWTVGGAAAPADPKKLF